MSEVTIQVPAWLARSHKLVSQDPSHPRFDVGSNRCYPGGRSVTTGRPSNNRVRAR